MPVNQFIGFATAEDANILSQADYAARDEVTGGMKSGVAESAMCNKVWRQGANMAAAIGEFIKGQGYDALDDGDINALSTALASALQKLIPALATHSSNGLMSAADKTALDAMGTKVSALTGVTAYNTSSDYVPGNVVTKDGELYLCREANGPNSGGVSRPNGNQNATWDIIYTKLATISRDGYMSSNDQAKLNSFYGILPYDTSIAYFPGKTVYYTGSVYIATQASGPNNIHNPTDTGYWQKVITAPMTGASASAAGAAGLVPAPAAGDNVRFLRGDGTWQPAGGDGFAAPAWSSSEEYTLGDIVLHNRIPYFCATTAHISGEMTEPGVAPASFWAPMISTA